MRFDINNVDDRRRLVVDMWAHGLKTKEIAERLDIHVSTVNRAIRLWKFQGSAKPADK